MAILETLGFSPKIAPPRPGTVQTLLAANPLVAERVSFIAHKDEEGRDRNQTVARRLAAKQEAKRQAQSVKAHHDAEYADAPVLNDLDKDGNLIDPGLDQNGARIETARGRHTSRSFIAGLDASIAFADSEVVQAEEDLQKSTADWTPWANQHARVNEYLAFYAQNDGHGRIPLNRPEVALARHGGDADRAHASIAEAVSDISQKLAATKSAYQLPDQTKAALLLDLGKRAAAPKVIIPNPASRGAHRHPYIKWAVDPLLGVESSNTNLVPSIDDALGVLIWLHHDEMVAAINAQVDAAYASFDAQGILVLDPQERIAREASLKAELLMAEHMLAEALWKRGDAFPDGIDVRAVLGIDGPEAPQPAW